MIEFGHAQFHHSSIAPSHYRSKSAARNFCLSTCSHPKSGAWSIVRLAAAACARGGDRCGLLSDRAGGRHYSLDSQVTFHATLFGAVATVANDGRRRIPGLHLVLDGANSGGWARDYFYWISCYRCYVFPGFWNGTFSSDTSRIKTLWRKPNQF